MFTYIYICVYVYVYLDLQICRCLWSWPDNQLQTILEMEVYNWEDHLQIRWLHLASLVKCQRSFRTDGQFIVKEASRANIIVDLCRLVLIMRQSVVVRGFVSPECQKHCLMCRCTKGQSIGADERAFKRGNHQKWDYGWAHPTAITPQYQNCFFHNMCLNGDIG